MRAVLGKCGDCGCGRGTAGCSEGCFALAQKRLGMARQELLERTWLGGGWGGGNGDGSGSGSGGRWALVLEARCGVVAFVVMLVGGERGRERIGGPWAWMLGEDVICLDGTRVIGAARLARCDCCGYGGGGVVAGGGR